jgi:hypothetical protein
MRVAVAARLIVPLVLLLSLAQPAAVARDDHAWVRDPNYVTGSGAHCCSEQHCRPAAAGELTPIPAES